ncbi:MAG: hypothetical protein K5945_07785 [Bacteroidaceae bacterium]|nr:hypothetical protein [Bacteroidaceae bacterium]
MKQRLLLVLLALLTIGCIQAQLPQDAKGFYLIATADDLVQFSAMTNDQSKDANRYLNGKLTADIDLSEVENFVPIGKHTDIDLVTGLSVKDWDYRGTFDGQGHTVRNLTVSTVDGSEGGLFSRIIDATIKNLAVENVSISCDGGIRAGAIIGIIIRGQVSNCYSYGKLEIVTTSKNTGGIAGTYLQNFGGSGHPMYSCFTTYPAVFGETTGDSSYRNCFAGEEVETLSPTGELCYKLNNGQDDIVFFQTLGEDAIPTFDSTHKRVYANGELYCDGTPVDETQVTYSNEMTSVIPPHTYGDDGICVVCGHDGSAFEPAADGWYEVTTPAQLQYISRTVNSGKNNIRVRLMNDLDMSEVANFAPIGYFDDYGAQITFTGTFDGQKHIIRNLKVDCEDGQECGLFGRVSGGSVYALGIENASITSHKSIRCGVLGGEIFSANVHDVFVVGEINISNDEGQKGGLAGEAVNTTFKNCWTTYENLAAATNTPENSFAGEDVEMYGPTGEMCYKLNNGSLLHPMWFQTVGTDDYPTFDETHGLVYAVSENEYASALTDKDYADLVEIIITRESDEWGEALATRSLVEAYLKQLEDLRQHTTRDAFTTAYEAILATRNLLTSSMQAYVAYVQKVDEVKAFLVENPSIDGPYFEMLKDYLEETFDPGDTFPNGSYAIIMENYALTTEEIIAEADYVQTLLDKAIATGYQAGADISNLLLNADFTNQLTGWTFTQGSGSISNANNSKQNYKRVMVAKENVDINQTLTDLKNGIYQIEIPGLTCLRSISDPQLITLYNYGGFIYANDMSNYMETRLSDMLSDEEVNDKNIVHSAARFNPFYEGDDDEPMGYAPNHAIGVAFGRDAGHYRNTILVNVTDGTLKVGVRNSASLTMDNLTYLLRATLTYQGTMDSETAGAAMDKVLADMQSKASHLIEDYTADYVEYADAPSFYSGLKDELTQTIATNPTTGEEKYALIARLSDIFQRITESKQAYEKLMVTANDIADIYGTYTSPELQVQFQLKADHILDVFEAGSATTDEVIAMTAELLEDPTFLRYYGIEPELVDGYYQIANAANLVWFSTYVDKGSGEDKYSKANAKLTADIDLAEIDNFLPIGMHIDTDNEAGVPGRDYAYRGKFDGQGHVIRNLTVMRNDYAEVGLFGRLIDADIRNLGIENARMSSSNGIRVGVIAGIILRGIIENCYTIGQLELSTENRFNEKCGIAGSILSFGSTAVATNLYTSYDILHAGTDFPPQMTRCYEGIEVEEKGPTGELCYMLNKNSSDNPVWFQTLGEDEYPVLDSSHKVVFCADGIYYNEASKPELVNGIYQLATPSDLLWFASAVNAGEQDIKGELTAAIDLSETTWTPIGTIEKPFSGTFDGHLLPITNIRHMLFGTTAGATITGVALESGHIEISSKSEYANHAGTIIGEAGTAAPTTLSYSYSKVNLTTTGGGDTGGISGKFFGTLNNCAYIGSISGDNTVGGLLGSSSEAATPAHISDSYSYVEAFSGSGWYKDALVGWLHDNCTIENTFAIAGVGGFGEHYLGTSTAKTVTKEVFASGEVAWDLNAPVLCLPTEGPDIPYFDAPILWTQKIGSDAYPVLGGTEEAQAAGSIVYRDSQGNFGNEPVGCGVEQLHLAGQVNAIYDLNGRKVNGESLAKGIYIIGQKKVAVK